MTPTLIVTRPASQGAAFAKTVKARWDDALVIILSPLVEIKPCPVTDDLSAVTGVIFTSANGVTAATRLGLQQGMTAWCVGQKTAALARDAGFTPKVGPGDAAGLVDYIATQVPSGTLAHIRGRHTRGDICARLKQAGILCHDVVGYDQIAVALNADAHECLKGKHPVLFPLFSPRTARILGKEGPFPAPVHCVVMSDAVRMAAVDIAADTVKVAARPDEKAMLDATIAGLQRLTQRRD